MDFSNLQDKVSNLTLYDLKAGVRKVQNGRLHRFDVAFIVYESA
jgi:epsin